MLYEAEHTPVAEVMLDHTFNSHVKVQVQKLPINVPLYTS